MIEQKTIYKYNECTIEADHEEEKVTIKTEGGDVELGVCYDDNGAMPGLTIMTTCNSPQGYIYLTPEQAMELVRKFSETAENSPSRYELKII